MQPSHGSLPGPRADGWGTTPGALGKWGEGPYNLVIDPSPAQDWWLGHDPGGPGKVGRRSIQPSHGPLPCPRLVAGASTRREPWESGEKVHTT